MLTDIPQTRRFRGSEQTILEFAIIGNRWLRIRSITSALYIGRKRPTLAASSGKDGL
jgi:hypothetical protein